MKQLFAFCLFATSLLAIPPALALDLTRSCLAEAVIPFEQLTDDTLISADRGEWDSNNDTLYLEGNVELEQQQQRLSADQGRFFRDTGQMVATGNVRMRTPEYAVDTEQLDYDSRTEQADIDGPAHYRIIALGGHGSSQKSTVRSIGINTFSDITYTTCPTNKRAWYLKAKRLDVNRDTGVATAYNAQLKVGETTVFWLPRFSFQADNQRKSGFLIPSYSYSRSQNTLQELVTPYYLNLAPNYDMTLFPRYLGDRGFLMGTEFRYLTEKNSGTLMAEAVTSDSQNTSDARRYSWRYRNRTVFNPKLTGTIDFSEVSDSDYFRDYGNRVGASSDRYITRQGNLNYSESWWNASLAMVEYQAIDAGTYVPYQSLPALSFSAYRNINKGIYSALNASFVRYETDNPGSPTGDRLDISPVLGADFIRPWGFVKTTLNPRFLDYSLNNLGLNQAGDSLTNKSPQLAIYSVAIDSGLIFERQTNLFNTGLTQTLEPRLFYTYTPYKNQDDLPLFNTTRADFTFDNLFRMNRFIGGDRVGDNNELVAALTTRFFTQGDGLERLRASIAQVTYFDEHRITLNDSLPTDDDAFVASLYTQLSELWSFETAMLQPERASAQKNSYLSVNFHDRTRARYASLTWRQRGDLPDSQEVLDYVTLTANWLVSPRVNLFGGVQYSLELDRYLDAGLGLEYDSCCWAIRTMVGQRADGLENNQQIYDRTIFIQFIMKGFADIDQGSIRNNDRILPRVHQHSIFETYY